MTIKQLQEWLFTNSLDDCWWHSQNGAVAPDPVQLSSIKSAVTIFPSAEHKIIHISQADHEQPPWIEVTNEDETITLKPSSAPRSNLRATVQIVALATGVILAIAGGIVIFTYFKKSPEKVETRASIAPQMPSILVSFLHDSRKMNIAISTGINFKDFHSRLPDILSAADEVKPLLTSSQISKEITLYVQSLLDIDSIWNLSVSSDEAFLPVPRSGISGKFLLAESSCYDSLSDRWRFNFPAMILQYGLSGGSDYQNKGMFDYPLVKQADDRFAFYPQKAVPWIFSYASERFHKIEGLRSEEYSGVGAASSP